MDASAALLLVLLLTLGLHAGVSLINAALQHVPRADMQKRAEEGDSAAQRFLAMTESGLRLSMTVSITHLLTRFVIAVTLLLLLVLPFAASGEIVQLLPAAATVLLGAGLTLVLGDLAPEAIGSSHAESLLPVSLGAMRLLLALVSPLTALVLLLSRLISRVFGSDALVSLVTEEEIMSLVYASHSGGIIEDEEKDMIASVLQLGESSARELMTPRIDIVALEISQTIMEALAAFVESGFSRIPVYDDSIDTVIGLLNAKDILTVLQERDDLASQQIRDLIRPTYFVPETKRADALLKELQAKNVHLAIVVDEYGGTSGLVTIEDLIEEIIGEIRDEYDFGEQEDYVEADDGAYIIEGSMDLDDLNDLLDCSIDTAAADTLGGYIYLSLGRVPRANETIATDILSMTVLSIDGHRIRKVRVRPIARETNEAEQGTGKPLAVAEKLAAGK